MADIKAYVDLYDSWLYDEPELLELFIDVIRILDGIYLEAIAADQDAKMKSLKRK